MIQRITNNLFTSILFFIIFFALAAILPESNASLHQGTSAQMADLGLGVINGRISMDIKDVEISRVLHELGKKTGLDIFVDKEVQGKISLKINNGTIDEVLMALCENRAIVYEYDPVLNSFRVIKAGVFMSSQEKGMARDEPATGDPSEPAESSPGTTAAKDQDKVIGQPTSPAETHDSLGRPLYKAGELLVKLKERTSVEEIAALHQALGSGVLKTISPFRIQRIKLKPELSEEEALNLYAVSGLVERAEKHALRYPQIIPDDEFFADQWNMLKIQAPQAWDLSRGSREIIVAVIDTGVNYLHPDLSANIWINEAEVQGEANVDDDNNGYEDDFYGWDFAGGNADPMDVKGHGTRVAGIIGALGNNNLGIAGLAWKVKIMPLKVQADSENEFRMDAIIEAIVYAVENGAHIVNCSYGGEGGSVPGYGAISSEEEAMIFLKEAGLLAICAAGNAGKNTDEYPNYPSSYDLDNIISVAASTKSDNLASYSNYGLETVDVMAPGDNIKSTTLSGYVTTASVKATLDGIPMENPASGMEYAGLTDQAGVTGPIYDCGHGYPGEFPIGAQDYIALIQRGGNDDTAFYFYEKTQNAQNKGAAAVIIYNHIADEEDGGGIISGTLKYPGDWVPVVFISNSDGLEIKGHVLAETISPATVYNVLSINTSMYVNSSGTSMATPHVSGLAALILSKDQELDYLDVMAAIVNNIDPIESVAEKIKYGGRINALKSLCSVSSILPGDLSGDGEVDLADVVIALQILSGTRPLFFSNCLATNIDVNGDQRIGLQEVVYILQKVGEYYK